MEQLNQHIIVRKFLSTIYCLTALTIFPSIAEAARSRDNRNDKFVSATLGTYGLSAGLFVTENLLLEGSYNYRQENEVWLNTYKGRIRSFIGNSFYGSLGGDYERRNAPPKEFGGEGIEADEFFLATAAMGNQWQWSSFTLGVDWVEFRVPVSRVARAHIAEPVKARTSPSVLGELEIRVFGVYAGISL